MTFSVLGIPGSYYGLAVSASAICYFGVLILLHRKTHFNAEAMLLYGILGIPLGIITSRAVFCSVNIAYFVHTLEQPEKMLYFWDGGYSMSGMLLGLVLAALIAAKLKKLNFKAFLDAVTLPMGILLFGLRLAEGLTGELGIGRHIEIESLTQAVPILFVSESFGTMELYRLAVFRLEAVFALLLFGAVLLFSRSKRRRDGDLTMLFFALQGAGQIVFESMRNDRHMVLGFIRVQQVIGLVTILIILAVFCRRYGKTRGAKDTVTAAYTMIPIAALVLFMMITPINHVLDLTGHLWTGILIVLPMAAYMAFFLRKKGANPRLILTWLAALLTVAACVMLEFSMDGSADIFRDYGLLALCSGILFLCPYSLYHALTRQER